MIERFDDDRVVSSQLSVVSCRTATCRPRTTDHGPRTRSFPQSPAPSPQPPRPGITLTEVLIAMGILTLGLLGVAALFPVGGLYMQKADDRRQRLGDRPIGDERHRRPRHAQSAVVDGDESAKPSVTANRVATHGFHVRRQVLSHRRRSSAARFTRPFAEALERGLAQPAALPIRRSSPSSLAARL